MSYKATSIEFHRNGVGGDPFTVVNLSGEGQEITAIVFALDLDEDAHQVAYSVRLSSAYQGVAVIQPDDPGAKFRGDYWAVGLREMIAHFDDLIWECLDGANSDREAHQQALGRLGRLVPETASMTYEMASTTANGGR